MIKRTSVSKREDIQDIKVLETPESRIIFEKKYSNKNRYDKFSLSNVRHKSEFYSIDIPKFVQVEYELLCWTNNTAQINEIVEQLIWFDGKAFGDTYKFNTYIDSPTFETINNTGEDRIVKASLNMRTKAHILSSRGVNAPILYKLQPVNKIILGTETDVSVASVSNSINSGTNIMIGGGRSSSGNANINSTILYLNSNYQLTGTVSGSNGVLFNSEWMSAPSPLPATSVNNFTFFINGQMLEKSAITSFTQQTGLGTSRLIINTSEAGFGLISSDEVIGIGKFINHD